MGSLLAHPAGEGTWPGIVFYSDIFQLTGPTVRWCKRLAGHGFVVLAPEIFHRIEPAGTVLAFDDEGKDRGQADAEATPVADFDADIRAALAFVAAHPRVASGQLGAAGHCTGGHIAFRAAFAPEVKATACWYPTGLHDGRLGKDPDAGTLKRAGEVRGELLMVFGTEDPHTPEGGRRTIKGALDESGRGSNGGCTTPPMPSAATRATATTPRRPTRPSPRPSPSTAEPSPIDVPD